MHAHHHNTAGQGEVAASMTSHALHIRTKGRISYPRLHFLWRAVTGTCFLAAGARLLSFVWLGRSLYKGGAEGPG